ncbi:hypothetical protein CDV31_016793, partial [Fusarium ambrosium]
QRVSSLVTPSSVVTGIAIFGRGRRHSRTERVCLEISEVGATPADLYGVYAVDAGGIVVGTDDIGFHAGRVLRSDG